MIPKIIHFCWLSANPYPEEIQSYMDSWTKHLPEYEIIHWNFERFDKNFSLWVRQAFEEKKYAFAADYIRLYSVYNYGGIYLDTDVEVLKSFNALLDTDLLMGYESSGFAEMAVLGAVKGHPLLGDLLNTYDKPFIDKNGALHTTPMPLVFDAFCKKHKYKLHQNLIKNDLNSKNINLLPCDFFSPKVWNSKEEINVTSNTVCIHHFEGSWLSKENIFKKVINALKKALRGHD